LKIQTHLGYLKSFCLSRKCNEFSLTISLFEGGVDRESLLIKFINIKDLKIGDLNNVFNLLINIKDISDRQMERIKYKVTEDEYDSFSFYCEAFEKEQPCQSESLINA